MPKRILPCLAAGVLLLFMAACKSAYLDAGKDLYTAATVSEAELIAVSREMRAQGDKENTVAPADNPYARRLARLTAPLQNEDGLKLNFKVYLAKDVNANATADGSIRVYSGLMDMLTDNELFFVVGHEVGHVKGGDSLGKIRMAYASSGLIKAASASAGAATGLNSQQLSSLLHQVVNAQFSQKQEYDADAYGYALMKKYKIDPKAAVSALLKIDKLGQSGGVMASHPNSADRARRIESKIKTVQ